MLRVKCVVVGDAKVGKTSFIAAYAQDKRPGGEDTPDTLEKMSLNLIADRQPCAMDVVDTLGGSDFDFLRSIEYPGTDVVLICFSVVSPESFENVIARWRPEVEAACPKARIVLVGTRRELRHDNRLLQELAAQGISPVTPEQAESRAQDIGAYCYVECSAESADSLQQVFAAAATAVAAAVTERRNRLRDAEDARVERLLATPPQEMEELLDAFEIQIAKEIEDYRIEDPLRAFWMKRVLSAARENPTNPALLTYAATTLLLIRAADTFRASDGMEIFVDAACAFRGDVKLLELVAGLFAMAAEDESSASVVHEAKGTTCLAQIAQMHPAVPSLMRAVFDAFAQIARDEEAARWLAGPGVQAAMHIAAGAMQSGTDGDAQVLAAIHRFMDALASKGVVDAELLERIRLMRAPA